jgi:hypothetical protein
MVRRRLRRCQQHQFDAYDLPHAGRNVIGGSLL